MDRTDNRLIAEQIFLAGVESVIPDILIKNHLKIIDGVLNIGNRTFALDKIDKIYVIGAGKATALMAAEVESVLENRITDGHIISKYGYTCKLKYIKITEAGHPVPDKNGFRATEEIVKIAQRAGMNDLVICLISGGGSALLADIPEGSSSRDMIVTNDLLVNSGANIREINAIRKHLSKIKGGQLARIVSPAILVSLILSDVPGDPLDVIASGPTIPDPTTYDQALWVIEKFNLADKIPYGIINLLKDGAAGNRPETPKPDDPVFKTSFNILIGTNRLALEASRLKAFEFNINPLIIDDQLQGDTVSVSEYIVETSLKFQSDVNEIKPVCLLFGGETTVKMTGNGLGGRNQHLALLCTVLLREHPGITILSAGTDGTDGPTEVAGAVVDSNTIKYADSKNIDPEKYILEFDSFHFFKKTGGQVITGPTQTNVMDIIVVIIEN